MSIHEMGSQPSLAEARRISLPQLRQRLAELEAEHGMSSAQFIKQWRAGELEETQLFSEWSRLSIIAQRLNFR